MHARQYAAGLDSARRKTSGAPGFVPAHLAAVLLHVGLAQIDEARAALETARALAPQLLQARLEGRSAARMSTDRRRCTTFLRIAAGLDYPSPADALR